MRKIKSVKLKNDYRTASYFLGKGYLLKFDKKEKGWISELGHNYSEEEIRDCKTDLFEIEYEEEKKYIDVRIEYYNDSMLGDFHLVYLQKFKDFIEEKCSDERQVKVRMIGRGTL